MKASRVLIRDFGEIEKLQVSEKGPGDFVTASDKRVEKIIINELNVENSKYSVLSEEIGELIGKNKEKRWIVDPIDGTTNFLNGLPHFAISIAYEEKGEILSGIIFDPIKNEMFFAEKGQGAYLNNIRTRVSNKSDFKNSLLVTGGPRYTSEIKDKVFKEYIELAKKVRPPIRKSGSAALDLAYVAAGRFDGSWQRELKYWDIAAGIIILKESGGFINNLRGDNYLQDKIDIVATNSKIHKELSTFL
jgi:myo-inositol-1(or 4)-monophosphatase